MRQPTDSGRSNSLHLYPYLARMTVSPGLHDNQEDNRRPMTSNQYDLPHAVKLDTRQP